MAEAEWTCQHCTCLNSRERSKCIACDSDLIEFGDVSTLKEDEWTCSSCTHNNSIDLLNCLACFMRNPRAPGIDATEDHVHAVAVGEPIGATACDVHGGDWVCPSCSSSNPVTSLNCVHCDDDQWFDVWSCPICNVDNSMNDVICQECEHGQQLLSTGDDVDAPQTQHPAASTNNSSKQRKLTELEEQLQKNIVGQKHAVSLVARTIRRKELGWHNTEKPLVFLFLGSSGIGKTEMVKAVSTHFKLKEAAFIRIDMSEYQEKHQVSKFIGSPPGYKGHDDGGQLTEKLKKSSNAVVLFDEVEKAHPDVLTILLQLFDEGRLTDGKGQTVKCNKATFFMTSNLGSDAITDFWKKQKKQSGQVKIPDNFKQEVIQPILKTHFKRDEFLGRINETVFFLPFTEDDLVQLVTREMVKWSAVAKSRHKIKVSWEDSVLKVLATGYNVDYGARSIIQEVERRIVNNLAELHDEYAGIVKAFHIHMVQAREADCPLQRMTLSAASTGTAASASPDHARESATSKAVMKIVVLDCDDRVRKESVI